MLLLAQSLLLHRPLPVTGEALGTSEVVAVHDAGPRGAVFDVRTGLVSAGGAGLLATTVARYLARGAGGFGGLPPPTPQDDAVPEAPPALVLDLTTRPAQAALFARLGDDNPIHLDATAARAAGFAAPVLHGLCTFGIVGEALRERLAEAEAQPPRLERLELDFRAPVYPGEPLRLEAWPEPGGHRLRLTAAARGSAVLSLGRGSFAGAARSSGRG